MNSEQFFCCYLLTSLKPGCQHHTYIGFTVDPARRIRQHNGLRSHGAWKTSRKRPWEMVVLVWGFPTEVAALKFEWSWQSPHKSRAVREAVSGVRGVGRRELLQAKISYLHTMLHQAPWVKYPLNVHWLTDQYLPWLAKCPPLPPHMKVDLGPLSRLPPYTAKPHLEQHSCSEPGRTRSSPGPNLRAAGHTFDCRVCSSPVAGVEAMLCTGCSTGFHVACLAGVLLREQELVQEEQHKENTDFRFAPLVPVTGHCPCCSHRLVWGDMVRRRNDRRIVKGFHSTRGTKRSRSRRSTTTSTSPASSPTTTTTS